MIPDANVRTEGNAGVIIVSGEWLVVIEVRACYLKAEITSIESVGIYTILYNNFIFPVFDKFTGSHVTVVARIATGTVINKSRNFISALCQIAIKDGCYIWTSRASAIDDQFKCVG